jgi:hypothetical protein
VVNRAGRRAVFRPDAERRHGPDRSQRLGAEAGGRSDLRGGGQNLAQLTAAAKQKGFKAVPLGLKVSFSFDNAIRRSVSHNVIGILPGKTRPMNTCSIPRTGITLAIARPMPRDDICNGAVDNATWLPWRRSPR